MIQCVGSRTPDNPNCSRICCQDALKNSIAIKERQPRARVVVLYRDLRAYGLKEDYYRKARDLGVLFFLYVPERKPEIIADGSGFKVRVDGKVLGGEMEIDADYLILSTGLRPREDAQQLSQTYKVTATATATSWRRMSSCGRSISPAKACSSPPGPCPEEPRGDHQPVAGRRRAGRDAAVPRQPDGLGDHRQA